MVKKIVHFEFLTMMLFLIYTYFKSEFSIVLFFLLFFVPDIAILFYKINNKVGGIAYNIIHTYIIPIILLFINIIFFNNVLFQSICIIWMSHISMDRFLGYGLKYDTFKETHIQKL